MNLIDTHCHLYLEDLQNELPDMIRRAEAEGVKKFFLPAIDSSETERLIRTEAQFPGKCIAMMGLHPCSVRENYLEELRLVEDWLKKRPFAAVGEIGLDYYWDLTFKNEQVMAFEQQIALAVDHGLPIVIHSRNSMDDCIDLVAKSPVNPGGIFHCFTGSTEQAKKIIDMGFYLGIGGVITYRNSGLAEVVKNIPLEHLVLETDAPYLSPVPFRGKRNESSYLKYIVQKLAEVKGISAEEVAEVTTANAEKVLSFEP